MRHGIAALVIVALVVAAGANASLASSGKARASVASLCPNGPDSSRGSVPSTYPVGVCIGPQNVWIRNTQAIAINIVTTGSASGVVHVSDDQSLADSVTRVKFPQATLVLPGDVVRVPIGSGTGSVRIADATQANSWYSMAYAAEALFPIPFLKRAGHVKSTIDAFSGFMSEYSADLYQYRDCISGATGGGVRATLKRAACRALLVRNVGFAAGRSSLSFLPGIVGELVSVVQVTKWLNSTLVSITDLLKPPLTLKINAATSSPPNTKPNQPGNNPPTNTNPNPPTNPDPPPPGATPSVAISNNVGQMAVQLASFPTGTAYFFCHSGDPSGYPTGGAITGHAAVTISDPNQSWSTGWCSGYGNAWVGIQAADGQDYYSNQTTLDNGGGPPSISVSNNGGQMAVQLGNFPTGNAYFFCHYGDPSSYPYGGPVTGPAAIVIGAPNQSWPSGWCSGSGNAWVGVQAPDGHDYYSNQTTLAGGGAPSVTLSVGDAVTTPTCTSSYCHYLRVTLNNFPAGTHAVDCYADWPPPAGVYRSYTTGDAVSQYCVFGYPGHNAWVTVDGIPSNTATWP